VNLHSAQNFHHRSSGKSALADEKTIRKRIKTYVEYYFKKRSLTAAVLGGRILIQQRKHKRSVGQQQRGGA